MASATITVRYFIDWHNGLVFFEIGGRMSVTTIAQLWSEHR